MNPRVSTEPPITPDTPRERELRKQVNDLHAKVHAQKEHIRTFETAAIEKQMRAAILAGKST